MKKIVCAPDSFKESLSATEVAHAMAAGIRRAFSSPTVTVDECPVGDGGEGTMDVLLAAMGGATRTIPVVGPLGNPIRARYGVTANGQTAIVELAEASGLALVPKSDRNPARLTTFGTGQLIRHAIDAGCLEVIVCIGGSATVDGGIGIAQALGATFTDPTGSEIESPITGAMLPRIARVIPLDITIPIRVACDVTNPLCGPNGAAEVYGPQKGATPAQVRELNDGLAHLACILRGDSTVAGAGAAGGAGFGLMAMCGATLERGIDLVLNAIRFDQRCTGAMLVLTGEGRLDRQSLHGKACMGVAVAAERNEVPAIAIVGSAGDGAEACIDSSQGGALKHYVSLSQRFGHDRAMQEPCELIAIVAEELAREWIERVPHRSEHD